MRCDFFHNQAICATGMGTIELGILYYNTNPPNHRCPFTDDLIDPSKRTEILNELDAARMKIESLLGDPTFFDQGTWATPNCITIDPIEG